MGFCLKYGELELGNSWLENIKLITNIRHLPGNHSPKDRKMELVVGWLGLNKLVNLFYFCVSLFMIGMRMRDVVKCFGCVFMIIVAHGWCCVSSVVFDVVGVATCWVYD